VPSLAVLVRTTGDLRLKMSFESHCFYVRRRSASLRGREGRNGSRGIRSEIPKTCPGFALN